MLCRYIETQLLDEKQYSLIETLEVQGAAFLYLYTYNDWVLLNILVLVVSAYIPQYK